MRASGSKAKLIIASIALAVLHYAVFTVSHVQSFVLPPSEQAVYRVIAAVLAFPLVHISDLLSSIDVFPIAVVANSLLWGALCVFGVRAVIVKRRKRAAKVK